jgi:response regulator RpfG family c-di-GMP phosphodiesterase
LPDTAPESPLPASRAPAHRRTTHRILIVDDQADIRRLCRLSLSPEGLACEEAGTGPDAIALAAGKPFDLVLLDFDIPGFNGEEVLRRLRQSPPCPNLKVVMFSGAAGGDELSRILLAGADDFLIKPFSTVQLRARVKSALRLKDAQDRSDLLNRNLLTVNAEMEKTLQDRDVEIIHARNGLVLALAKLVEHRSKETGPHLMRLQRYSRILAEEAATLPAFASLIDANFIRTLEDTAPLHDIGKAAIPDAVLNKPGAFTDDERSVMQTHTTIGANTLREVARRHPFSTGFLQMAIDIAQHHHEKWDGTGYPHRLAGGAIPLAARLLAIGDVYDAMRSPRVYKDGRTHAETTDFMLNRSPGHFDPALLDVFRRVADRFEQAFAEVVE